MNCYDGLCLALFSVSVAVFPVRYAVGWIASLLGL